MKRLPYNLRKNGNNYSLLYGGCRAFLYELREQPGDSISYEVFRLKVRPERMLKGKRLEASEIFPHNEAFGIWAWLCKTLDKALKKYHEIESG